MAHLIDARAMLAAFADSHEEGQSGLVLALLALYLESGPFEFDAAQISHRLEKSKLHRGAPEFIAQQQTELERFFLPTPAGWKPRPGVLALSDREQ